MELALNRTHCMDNREGMKLLPDNFVDLTVTSPPYDDLRSYKGCKWDFNIFKEIANELFRVTKEGGIVVWIVGDKTHKGSETGTSFRQALYFKEIGFNLHDTMIYHKNMLTFPDKNRYYQCFEYMFVLSKGKPKTANLLSDRKNSQAGVKVSGGYRDKDGQIHQKSGNKKGNTIKEYGVRTNIWCMEVGFNKSTLDKIAYKHPAIFPEKLVEDHIHTWSNVDDIVLDIFAGSGTTHKMCRLNNRKYIGFEISKDYTEIEKERLGIFKE